MKKYYQKLNIFLLLACIVCYESTVVSQNNNSLLLHDITRESGKYRGKKITATLRFKNIDFVFNSITFYDKKNIDISFDISIHKAMIEYQLEMLNLHRGLEYKVSFLVNDVDNQGVINGELISFIPLLLYKLPGG
ncbi:MAG TPA: hypothetical protein PK544_13300 [Spirochaetota bacterium]|nr:hypothetical protein [Spirochaetota bacterium]HPQ51657.1 hypothetical protein [Spirochaetota bacterium]